MSFLKHLIKIICLSAIFSAPSAWAQLNIDIKLVYNDKLPAVATAHFAGEGNAPVNITDVIRADLARSGRLSNAPVGGLTLGLADPVNLKQWQSQDAIAVVTGNVTPVAGGYQASLRLYDTSKGSLGDYSVTVSANGLRNAGHKMADFIYEKLLGMRGAFNTRLSYVDAADGKYRLLISDSDGDNAVAALVSKEPIISPSWSPSGKKVAYVSFENKKPVVYVHELATGQRAVISGYKGNNSAPAWSPDGQSLALALSRDGNTQIYQVSANGGNLKRLTTSQGSIIDTEPQYSPDGRFIYFTSDRGGEPQIYRMSAEGEAVEGVKRMTYKANYNTSPRISPDGNHMAFISRAAGYQVHLMDLRNGDVQNISNTSADESPSFAANGQVILYGTRVNGRKVLAASSIDGRMQQILSLPSNQVSAPAWGPFLER
nr:Tol-Pal system beta propeller repeat protein TolB [Hydromonas duriensis]